MADREQIEKMAQAMCGFCAVDKRCILKYSAPCSDIASQDCTCKESAEELIHKGYGKVSEYKAEIERLKAEFKQLETNAEILARGVRDLNHENYELTEKVKQAQIDVLNKIKTLIFQKDNPYNVPFEEFISANVFCGYIDELIKEVQNEN